ncbi:beta/gamma crystallin-related protein [Floridanema aerugineum]|uniref:Beta/gamma crystallin-related protein n=1 Tax=Floridaenema aerugineum BLCC-F46 TaxID=3153654 RepID=A0ABV4X9I8_9CYAN
MKNNQRQALFTEPTSEFEAPAFTELDDEVAATCSGGRVYFNGPDPDVILFEHNNFGGASLGVNATTGDGDSNLDNAIIGSGWNNRVSSIKIFRGKWQLFRDSGYQGPHSDKGRGNYKNAAAFGLPNDSLTGIRRVGA